MVLLVFLGCPQQEIGRRQECVDDSTQNGHHDADLKNERRKGRIILVGALSHDMEGADWRCNAVACQGTLLATARHGRSNNFLSYQ